MGKSLRVSFFKQFTLEVLSDHPAVICNSLYRGNVNIFRDVGWHILITNPPEKGYTLKKKAIFALTKKRVTIQKQSEYQDAHRQLIILLKREGFPSGEEKFLPAESDG